MKLVQWIIPNARDTLVTLHWPCLLSIPFAQKKHKWIVKLICKKYKRIVITKQHLRIKDYKQVASCFHCSVPRTSDDMFDVDNMEDLKEVSKTFTSMCQEDIDVSNINRCHPKSCIIHYFPLIPTCARPYLKKEDEPLNNDLTSTF